MNILSLEHIDKAYSERPLLSDTDFFLQEGDKVGIVGVNGTGKSTLLKIAAGIISPDSGKRTVANHVVIQYLPQVPVFDEDKTVFDHAMDSLKEDVSWDMEGEVKAMLEELALTDLTQNVRSLSGGQRKRLALAEVLLKPSDILILDEPTNHLDLAMADWLEDYLRNMNKCLIMVTHDRYFLDSVSNRIVEVDHGKIYNYDANYAGYLELKAEREQIAVASERKRQSLLRTELEWVMRGARARSTKQKAHLQRYEDLKNKKAPVTDKQIEMSSISKRMGNTTIELDSICKAYPGRQLINNFTYNFLKNDRVGFIGPNGCGKTTLMKMIVGLAAPDSGSIKIGQTIKIGYYTQEIVMKGEESRKKGKPVRKNDPGEAGFVSGREYSGADNYTAVTDDYTATADQDRSGIYSRMAPLAAEVACMDPGQRVIDYIRDTAEYVHTADGVFSASVMLDRFLFPPQEQYALIEKLSGGERRRLNLLRVLMEAPNVLILDEPTNDLDITTLAILEDYLDHFDGIVITVSHDRYFLDRIVRRIFSFEEGGVLRQYEGGYTDYIHRREEEGLPALGGITYGKNSGSASLNTFTAGQQARSSAGQAAGQQARSLAGQSVRSSAGSVSDLPEHAEETAAGSSGSLASAPLSGREAYAAAKANREKKLKFSFKEQREYDTIEDTIAELEEKIDSLDKEMASCTSDFVKLTALNKEKEETENLLEEKMERWEYLEDLAARIAQQDEGRK